MSRIQIQDLTSVETLTLEQEELILGAGLRSFRPRLEGLEDRQMLDAGLGRTLLQNATTGKALVGSMTPEIQVPTSQRFDIPARAALPRGQATPSDASILEGHASKFLKETIIGNGPVHGSFSNRWMLRHNNMMVHQVTTTGNRVEVQFRLWYGTGGGSGAIVQFVFEGRMQGGERVFHLAAARLHNYNGSFGGAFEGVAKGLFQDNHRNGIRIHKYNPNADLANHSAAEDRLKESVRNYLEARLGKGNVTSWTVTHTQDGCVVTVNVRGGVQKWEIDTNPNFKKQVVGSLTLKFRYDGMSAGEEQYTVVGVESRLEWKCWSNVRRETYSANLGDLGLNAATLTKDFSTTKTGMVSLKFLADQAMTGTDKILASLGFKDIQLSKFEELKSGVRLTIRAIGPDGRATTILVDIAHDPASGKYTCVRASDEFDSVTPQTTSEQAGLNALVKNLGGTAW